MTQRILFAVEMIGTLNGLKKPLSILGERGVSIAYAAGGAAQTTLKNSGTACYTISDDPAAVVADLKPNLVIVGAVAGVAQPSGVETGFGLAALDAGIPTVLYRDFSGLNDAIARPLTDHARSLELLRFFLFDEATVRTVRERGYRNRAARAVGSSYYDEDATRNWAKARKDTREVLGILEDERVVAYLAGSERNRVIESLEPIADGLGQSGAQSMFLPFFHPKDPDAPFTAHPTEKGQWVRRDSVYDAVLDRLPASIKVMREPSARNQIADGKLRLAAADFAFVNPLSTDTWTAVYSRTPFACPVLPLVVADGAKSGVSVPDLDFIAQGAADAPRSDDELRRYAAQLFADRAAIAERLRKAQEQFTPRQVAPQIADALLGAMEERR